ncbi:hypothetical protein [Gelidibacter japonicus]
MKKNGAKKAPVQIIEICDAIEAVKDTYEKIWIAANGVAIQ